MPLHSKVFSTSYQMSDTDDAQSEAPPDSWTASFNQFRGSDPGEAKAGSKTAKRKPGIDQKAEASGGWFSGWGNTSPPAPQEGPESDSDESDSIKQSKHESQSESEGENEDERYKLKKTAEESSSGPEEDADLVATSDVDSDGFPRNKPDAGSDLGAKDDLGTVLEAELEEKVPLSPRRARLRNKQNFVVVHDAADVAATDITVAAESVPAAAGTASNWWDTLLVAAPPVPPTAVEEDTKNPAAAPASLSPAAATGIAANQAPKDEAPKEEAGGGFWSSMFGGEPKPDPEEAARALLPKLEPPPNIDAAKEFNSYFDPPPMDSPLDILAPRPMMHHYQGKVRGWPRQLAPYWDSNSIPGRPSHGARALNLPKPTPSQINGVSALAMFRVT